MGLAEFSVTPLCWRLLVAALITHCLVWAIIILRLYCRVTYNIKAFWEDLFVIIATLTTTVILALSSILVKTGLGYPDSETAMNYSFNGKLGFTVSLLYIFGIICARFALFFLYLRAFPVPWLQFATKLLMVLSTCLIISIILWDIFLCRPVRQLWDLTASGTCGDPGPPYKAGLILGISTDVIAIILPLPLIWGLHTSRQNKISLTCLFAVGLSTAGIASWRLTTLSIINSKTRAILFFSAVIEIGMVVVCSSVPIVYPLFSRRRQKCTSNPPPGAPKAAGAGRIARAIRTFGSITFRRQSYNHLDSDLNTTFGSHDVDTVASNATRPSGLGIEVVQEWSVVNSPKPDTTYV